MKTAKLIIGIISMVLFLLIMFQSCAAGIANAMVEDTSDTSGSMGVLVAFCVLIAGIIGVVTREKAVGSIVAGVFYLFGGIIGITGYGTYADLQIWAILSFIFAAVFIVGTILKKPSKKAAADAASDTDTSESTASDK